MQPQPTDARSRDPRTRRRDPGRRRSRPATSQRTSAAIALVLALATIVFAVVVTIDHFPTGLAVLACLVGAVCAACLGLVRRGTPRVLWGVAAVLLVGGAAFIVVAENRLLKDLLVAGGVIATVVATRAAFTTHVRWPAAEPPSKPVLFYNPLSGGGKAERFHLADEARRRGIEPIKLQRGDDLETLVREAVAGGADALAMAGGDGSQAIVAMVAAECDLPYACIPSGTRNHFALDLGVDRDDVVGALDAFADGGERRVDLAEVNGRVFVNNVSLGLYAEAVDRPGYREAKLHTLLEIVPDVLGADATPLDLRWSGADRERPAVAILVSNNAYRLGKTLGSGTRPSLDRGQLGIAVLAQSAGGTNGPSFRRLVTQQWSARTFEVQAGGPVAAGIDGESVRLDPPLRFRTRPGALRVRIAHNHPGASPSALEPDAPRKVVGTLLRLAAGRPPAT
jgi:diacylglycerol kinase family enzyme